MRCELPPWTYKYGDESRFGRYYPAFITRDKDGYYGIYANNTEFCRLVNGKALFEKIGIPEFDLCEWQEDYVLQRLQKSLYLDILNEAFDFKSQPWAIEEEEKFFEKHNKFYGEERSIDPRYTPGNYDWRKWLFGENSKYTDAPYFYLAHLGHICIDVHRYMERPQGLVDCKAKMWRIGQERACQMSKQLNDNDVLIVPRNAKVHFDFDERIYFCILRVASLSSFTSRYIEFNFALLFPRLYGIDSNGLIGKRLIGNGTIIDEINNKYEQLEGDIISILTKNRTKDAFIILSNCIEKECHAFGHYYNLTFNHFSYNFATAEEILRAKEILQKK